MSKRTVCDFQRGTGYNNIILSAVYCLDLYYTLQLTVQRPGVETVDAVVLRYVDKSLLLTIPLFTATVTVQSINHYKL